MCVLIPAQKIGFHFRLHIATNLYRLLRRQSSRMESTLTKVVPVFGPASRHACSSASPARALFIGAGCVNLPALRRRVECGMITSPIVPHSAARKSSRPTSGIRHFTSRRLVETSELLSEQGA